MICDEMDDMLDNHLLSYNQNSNKQNQLCGVISLKRAKKMHLFERFKASTKC